MAHKRSAAGSVFSRATRTTIGPPPGYPPGTNQVEPLPASIGRWPVASPSRSRQPARRGSTRRAAGSRSLKLSETGPPISSQARYTAAVATPKGGTSNV